MKMEMSSVSYLNTMKRDHLLIKLASTTTRPGDAAPQVVEALRKAGVTDFPSVQNVEAESPRLPENLQSSHIAPPQPLDEEDSMKFIAEATRTDKLEDLQRSEAQDFKSTTGNNDSGNAAKPLTERTTVDSTVSLPGLNRSATRNVVSSAQINPPLQSTTVADQIENDTTPLVIPTDESPEDAALRRQMIQYGLHEVGAVVAELDLDEDSESQFSFSADDSDDDQQHSSSAEEEEDKFGRTTRRVVDDDYRREMLDLENKLKARATKAIEPIVPRSSPEVNGMSEKESTKLPGTSVLRDKVERSTVKKKGVRFAEELDISPAPAQGSTSKPTRITAGEAAPAIRDAIVERAAPRETPSTEASPMPQRVSRFKTARAAANYNGKFPAMRTGDPHIVNGPLKGPILERGLPNATPSLPLIAATSGKRKDFTGPIQATGEGHARQMPEGPQGKTHVHSIIEHEVSSHEPDAPDPDDMDPALLQQEVAIEYHRMRNRMIQRQGGFLPRDNEDEERVPLTEEEGGTGKKMSRFKAARLRKHA